LILSITEVESAIGVRVDELTTDPDSFGAGLEQQFAELAPGPPSTPDLEAPFIGGLDAPSAYGVIDGKRVPVDPTTGLPIDPDIFHQPKGIYDAGTEGRYGRSRTDEEAAARAYDAANPYLQRNTTHIQRYHYGFQWEPASWDPVEVARVKDRLIEAGLLDEEDRSSGGGWSHYEAKAFESLAIFANGTGEVWSSALGELERNPVGGGGGATTVRRQRDPFVAPSYLAPDMDILKQAVKDSVRGRLGREPTGGEMSQLIVGLDQDYRSAYDVQVQASRSEYDATTRAIESGAEQSGGEFRNVDPASSFAERFESRFDNELGFKKRRDDLNTRQSYTDATMRMIDSVVGGG